MKDINLLPDDIKAQPSVPSEYEKSSSSKKTLVLSIMVIIILGLILFAPRFYIMTLKANLDSLNKELNGPKYTEIKTINAQLAEKASAISNKGDIINYIDNTSHPISQLLPMIKKQTPLGCNISKIDYNVNTISISGIASDKAVAAEFLTNLNRISYITQQNVGFSSTDKGQEFNFTFFYGGKGVK